MKIGTYILILTFLVHLNFVELSSQGDSPLILPPKKRWQSSSSRPSQQAVGELNATGLRRTFSSRSTPILAHNPPAGTDTEGPAHRTIPYGDRLIQLWLDRQDPRRVVKADYQGNYAPTLSYIVSNDFSVKLIDVGGFKIVGHIKMNGMLSGVRAPNPNARRNDIEPTPSKWFIIYYGRAFKVTLYPATRYVRGVFLVPQNLHRRQANQRGMETTNVNFENIHFIIFHGPTGILGAELNPARHH